MCRVIFNLSYNLFYNVSKIDPMSLLIGGRIFYEIDLIDTADDTMKFMHFHSALDVIKEFQTEEYSNKSTIIIVVVIFVVTLIIIIILFVLYIRNKKKNHSGPSQIEFNQLN